MEAFLLPMICLPKIQVGANVQIQADKDKDKECEPII